MKKILLLIIIFTLLGSCSNKHHKKKSFYSKKPKNIVRRMPAYNRKAIEKSQGVSPVIPIVYDEKAEYKKLVNDLKEEIQIEENKLLKEVRETNELKPLLPLPKDRNSNAAPASPEPDNIQQTNLALELKDKEDYSNLLNKISQEANLLEQKNTSTKVIKPVHPISYTPPSVSLSVPAVSLSVESAGTNIPLNIFQPPERIVKQNTEQYIVPPSANTLSNQPRFVIATSSSYEGIELEEAKQSLEKFGRIISIRSGEKSFIVVEPYEGLYTEVEAKNFFNRILKSSFLDIYIKKI